VRYKGTLIDRSRISRAIGLCIFAIVLTAKSPFAAEVTVFGKDLGSTVSRERIQQCNVAAPEFKMNADTFVAGIAGASKALNYCGLRVTLTGEIDAASMSSLRRVLDLAFSRFSSDILVVSLNSNGGDVWEALSFARFIRAHNLQNVVIDIPEGSHCYSSCVSILAGAFRRIVDGEVGIHRPYFSDKRVHEVGYKSLQQAYDALFVQLKAFVSSVNVSDRLVSEMWVVPSDKLRVLSQKESEEYGLASDDAIFAELENAKVRSVCGEGAPTYWNDYYKNVLYPCTNEQGRVNTACINERGRNHPYCHCFADANPKSGFVCD
jgi:hypothetical protein